MQTEEDTGQQGALAEIKERIAAYSAASAVSPKDRR